MTKEDVIWATEVLEKIEYKLRWVAEKTATKIPYTTDLNGNFDDHSKTTGDIEAFYGLSWWTNGFYPGMLWSLYYLTKNKLYRKYATEIEDKLSETFAMFEGLHHDVGFMFYPTSVVNYTLTDSEQSRARGLHAATILAGRFNLAGRFLRAWNDDDLNEDKRGWTIIDSMMNIKLLYWASEETKDPRFKQIAQAHATTVQKSFIRSDGSVKHIVAFDPETGQYCRSYGGQGFGHGSAWTRGQAWAVYGFTVSYEQTENQSYLETAMKVADYFIAHMPKDLHVPIDFKQPKESGYEDSSATTIFVSGLLQLSQNVKDPLLADKYYQFAIDLLRRLVMDRVDFTTARDNLVTGASAAYHESKHSYAIIYADYFLIEGLMKIQNNDLDRLVLQYS